MTSGRTVIRLLGPLELRRDGDAPVSVGGAKQRALFGALLVEAGKAVSTDALVAELWEDDPPPSAAHTLEASVSRLRGVIGPLGLTISRRGAGYVLDAGDAWIDAVEFRAEAAAAREALAGAPTTVAIELGRGAMGLWRGEVLDNAPLGPLGRSAASGLEEERLRLLELVLDAELALGRHAAVLPELQAAVAVHPFRERFVLQLMLALYRCGRHADALAVYERTRAALDDQLGLQPSPELQRLSARIVRHDPELDVPAPFVDPVRAQQVADPAPNRRRLPVVLVAATIGAATLAVGVGGGSATPEPATASGNVALVLPHAPTQRATDLMWRVRTEAERAATTLTKTTNHDLEVETVVLDDTAPDRRSLEQFASSVRQGAYELVVWVGDGEAARRLAPLAETLPDTRFAYVAASLEDVGLAGAPNASAVRFADEESSHLMGFLSGLVAPVGADDPWARSDVVGIVAGPPTTSVLRAIEGFEDGLRRSGSKARLIVDHSASTIDKLPCEKLANRQVDAGADIVVSMAGVCGLGAIAVATARNVWAIGDDEAERMAPERRNQLLANTYRDTAPTAADVVYRYAYGTLPGGKTTVLGLEENYSVGVWTSDAVPETVASRVVHRCSELREASRLDPTRAAT